MPAFVCKRNECNLGYLGVAHIVHTVLSYIVTFYYKTVQKWQPKLSLMLYIPK